MNMCQFCTWGGANIHPIMETKQEKELIAAEVAEPVREKMR
jgi:hypothetical protein